MPLEKACIKVLDSCTAGGVSFDKDEKIFVQFNPEKYSLSTSLRYSFAEKEGKLYGQYSGEEPRTLSMELFFDALSASSANKSKMPMSILAPELEALMDEAAAVTSHIGRIMALTKASEKGAPPLVEFMWGSEHLKGVIASASLNYLLFNKKGEPTRATLSLTFRECDDVTKVAKSAGLKLSSNDLKTKLDEAGAMAGEKEVMEAVIKAIKLL